jgi:quinol-cytochrome oxidoreductase complex cytochrome b subunit
MIALLIFLAPIFFMIRPFRDLAYDYGRHRGGYAFLAIGTYIAAYIFFGIIIGFIMAATTQPTADDTLSTYTQRIERNSWLALFMIILAASLSVVGLYYILKSSWKKNPKRDSHPDLLDSK